jgi:hypothetical protein
MQITLNFGRWTATKAALAVAGLLAIGGAVGSALAISPTLEAPIKWQGGWEASPTLTSGENDIYTVPSGKVLMITDIIATNLDTNARSLQLRASSGACFTSSPLRSNLIAVPPLGSTIISFQTGIGFPADKHVCFSTTSELRITARGFLFTPN